jgi:acetamidase/formamidase
VLAVELLEFDHEGFGVTYFYPSEKGLLPEDFDDPGLYTWDLDGDVGHFVDGIEVPLDPFPGIVGLAPSEPGAHSTTPPRRVGGNLDVKHLTAGSTVYLPVEVGGGLFSIGDCHAAQGDGEVCVTGIEAPMSVTARLSVRSGMEIDQPQFETSGPFTPTGADESMYGTTGVADELLEATTRAVRHMIDHLNERRGLTREQAYLLCSVAVDLKISQVVNEPTYTVSAYLPESIFPEE